MDTGSTSAPSSHPCRTSLKWRVVTPNASVMSSNPFSVAITACPSATVVERDGGALAAPGRGEGQGGALEVPGDERHTPPPALLPEQDAPAPRETAQVLRIEKPCLPVQVRAGQAAFLVLAYAHGQERIVKQPRTNNDRQWREGESEGLEIVRR